VSKNILVVGDVMLDRYWHADTDRISPEAPVPVAKIKNIQDRPGGAANVAQNISILNGVAQLIGVTGDDAEAVALQDLLATRDVELDLIKNNQLRTTAKIRVVSRNQQLLRLDFDDGAHANVEQVISAVAAKIADCDIVLLSDYGKGVLSDPQAIIQLANQHNKKTIVDPKGTDFSKYRDASVITPNYPEFCAVVGECKDEQEIHSKAIALCKQLNLQALLITRSAEGMSLVTQAGDITTFPAQVREVYDVTGAGDTVIAVFALWLARGFPLAEAAKIANVAASIVVGKFGASTVTIEELEQALLGYDYPQSKLIELSLLVEKVDEARKQNRRIVFTNGCFDVLHKGHAYLLHQAAQHGDMLIVGLNSDGSVRALKGSERPINNLQDRAEMLSHLNTVDWVVAFEDETPLALIKALRPDVLIKGGDYNVDQIVGADYIQALGGEVKTIPIIEGYSTTKIINTMSNKS
jgi:D-beta-D-heptose 7-phosphate kinase/D-beta-D-heptose 1-phosphate adenosyltransferase